MTEPELAPVSHGQLIADVHALAAAIEAGGWRPDHIVGIPRGGLVPAVYLSHRTGIPLLAIDPGADVSTLARIAGEGRRVLLIDDVNDSGLTIATLRRRLAEERADARQARFAVLLDNVRSGERVEYRARTVDRSRDKRWFVFPWEAMADRRSLLADAAAMPSRIA